MATTEDVKDDDKTSINVKVASQEGEEIYFKIKSTTTFGRLMTAYCEKRGVPEASLRFLYDGIRLAPDKTPKDLEMENEDVIDAVVMQTGGSAMPMVPCSVPIETVEYLLFEFRSGVIHWGEFKSKINARV